jgi:hypothetical protein
VEEERKTREISSFGTIEPVSTILLKELSKLKDAKQKQRLLRNVINDNNHFKPIDLGLQYGAKTTIAAGSKIASNRKNTLAIAKDLNKRNIRVAFLAESDAMKSADAIIEYRGKLYIADFKHSTTTKSSTIYFDLKNGFKKAQIVALKVTHADKGHIESVIDELSRKNQITGNLLLINKLGTEMMFSKRELTTGYYKKKMKGFL